MECFLTRSKICQPTTMFSVTEFIGPWPSSLVSVAANLLSKSNIQEHDFQLHQHSTFSYPRSLYGSGPFFNPSGVKLLTLRPILTRPTTFGLTMPRQSSGSWDQGRRESIEVRDGNPENPSNQSDFLFCRQ